MASSRINYTTPPGIDHPYNAPVSFYFKVVINDGDAMVENAFQDVSGINVSLETKTVEEGGVLDYSHKLPVRAKYDNLVLKRGFLHGSSLLKWVNDAVRNFTFTPKLVKVYLMNENGDELVEWAFANAYPVALKISDFKSTDNSIVIETIELAYNFFERKDIAQSYNIPQPKLKWQK